MKSTLQIICKVCILFLFLYMTPFISELQDAIGNEEKLLNSLVYKRHSIDETISIKEQLNVLSYNSNFTLKKEDFNFESTEENPKPVPEIPQEPETPQQTGKRIYLYNTHQSEAYAGGETVVDAAAILANLLQEKGHTVVLETNDFAAYGRAHNMDYNQSYKISYNFLNEAFVNYGGFDLVIDLHRDAIPREASYIEANGKRYAKMMMVVGGLSSNATAIKNNSSTLSDMINNQVYGIMRSMMVREAYYNQEMSPNMVLIELGGDVNSFEEVKNSLPVLADGITNYLR